MNIKGLRLTREFIRILNSQRGEIKSLKGCIDPFIDFQWKGFKKAEFFQLISAFIALDSDNCFASLPDDYLFVFNFSNDVTEMDIATLLKTSDQKDVFLDIEVKNGDEAVVGEKLDNQLTKRNKYQLAEFLQKDKYILIGVLNDKFRKAYYFNGAELETIENTKRLSDLINSLHQAKDIDSILYQKSNIGFLQNIWKEIQSGTFHYYEETDTIYNNILEKINKEKAIFVYGNAGSGKSVLALRLFGAKMDNTKFLLLNSKLYNVLGIGGPLYSSGKTTFNAKCFINELNANSLAIVDECQRLSFDQIRAIIEKSKCAVFFGDEKQACFENGTSLSSKELDKAFKKQGYNCWSKTIVTTKRYSDEVGQAIDSLLFTSKKKAKKRLPYGYDIYITFKQSTFLEKFDSCNGLKKIYVPVSDIPGNTIKIDGRPFLCASKIDDRFSADEEDEMKFGNTFHAISFDIDHCFVYLPDTKWIKFHKKDFLLSDKVEKTESEIKRYQKELNVLFTRGRKSLTICTDNISAYLLLRKRWLKMKNGK